MTPPLNRQQDAVLCQVPSVQAGRGQGAVVRSGLRTEGLLCRQKNQVLGFGKQTVPDLTAAVALRVTGDSEGGWE